MKNILTFSIFLTSLIIGQQAFAKCYNKPKSFFIRNTKTTIVYTCSSKKRTRSYKTVYCDQKKIGLSCKRVNIQKNFSKLNKVKNYQNNKKALATYLTLLNWKGSIQASNKYKLNLQIGKYAALQLNHNFISAKCFDEIMEGAVSLSKAFKQFSFSLSEEISSCRNLSRGIRKMISNKKTVSANLARFHTPLHSIYFGKTTKFNHYLIGQMGLHINVNRSGEITRRIIQDEISTTEIEHEKYRSAQVDTDDSIWSN